MTRRFGPALVVLCGAALLAPSALALEFGDAKEVTKAEEVENLEIQLLCKAGEGYSGG